MKMDFTSNPACFPYSDENSLYLDLQLGYICYSELFAK